MQALEKAQRQAPLPSAQHTPTMQFVEGHEMPPVSHAEARPSSSGAEQADVQRGAGKPVGLVKGFSVTGPPSLTGPNQGFSVVSRGNGKAVTKIF